MFGSRTLILFFLLFCAQQIAAQQIPIGTWRSLQSFTSAKGIVTDGQLIYTISGNGFYSFDPATWSFETYSKVEGMHESETAKLGYDKATNTCIIGYQNSMIDLFKDNSFQVIPDLKNKNFSGSKAINSIYTLDGIAYLSTGLGVVVLDLKKQEIKETFVFTKQGQTLAVNGFASDPYYFYAATSSGLYRTDITNPNPQVFSTWQSIDSFRNFSQLALVGKSTLFCTVSDTVFGLTSFGGLAVVATRPGVRFTSLSGGATSLYVGEFNDNVGAGKLLQFNTNYELVDSTIVGYPSAVIEAPGGTVYAADAYQGMLRKNSDGTSTVIHPDGPNSPDCADLWVDNGEVWIAHGGVSGIFTKLNNTAGLSHFSDNKWSSYTPYNYPLFRDSVRDFMSILKDPRDGTVYAGSYSSGIFKLKASGVGSIIKQGDLEFFGAGVNGYPATSLALDNQGNLFATQIGVSNELAVKTTDGDWYHYPVSRFGRLFRQGFGLLIDDYNQKWYCSAVADGVIVYDDGGTPDNPNDDRQTRLTTGKGSGNLPNMTVRCLAKDRDGSIWIGTDAGIGIVNCPSLVIDQQCDAEQRVVQYDNFAGLLFSNESVRAIAVDGANRKWVGTQNGVWLLSPDALTILNRFTVDNSPLPANLINKIAVDNRTGEVYISTAGGVIVYRGTATTGAETAGSIEIFPNPVPPSYSGTIAFRGLTTDADVRITDITGKLVYRTKANGGQATWNGLDYTGGRPSSGVYLIFASDKMGTQKAVGKQLFQH
ncbi:MAG: hypothetical protein JST36_00230 [Bacteroidetes bacterium]|nr:hypothetical protein [Bacteroidota bacterium]